MPSVALPTSSFGKTGNSAQGLGNDGLGIATLNGLPFPINPSTVKFDYQVHTFVQETIGGRVIQVYGSQVSHMIVSGAYGGFTAQDSRQRAQNLMNTVKGWIDNAADNAPPLRFTYPPESWDFQVRILALKDQDSEGDHSVSQAYDKLSYKYILELFIVEDNVGLTTIATDQFISRLSDGLGWKRTAYQGNLDVSTSALSGGGSAYDTSFDDWIKQYGGEANTGSAAGAASTSSATGPSTGAKAHKVGGFTWKPVGNTNHTPIKPIGLCLHVAVGNGSVFGEFNTASSKASSNFWVGKNGEKEQYVYGDEEAWCQGAGNSQYNSVETEGFPNEPLTAQQIDSLATIYADGIKTWGWPSKIADTPGDSGFIWHGAGGAAWGGHPLCPGDIRKAQRPAILSAAAAKK